MLDQQKKIDQVDIDQFYWTEHEDVSKVGDEFEKGLTESIIQLILSVINSFDQPFTIQNLTNKTSLSHVSIRKYIHYLTDCVFLEVEQRYGTVGRPINYYKKKDLE